MSLGIIDWGIGGVSVYKLLKQLRPDTPVIYFSDTGVTPYGKMTRGELASRLDTVIDFQKTRGVTHMVIGCNAASTAIPFLKPHGIPIEGVIDTAVQTTAKLKPARLGLIGGRRTVLSGVYRDAFARRGIAVRQRIAQPLSGLIEAGDIGSKKLQAESARILGPLRNCSHILLACTHYPAITTVLESHVSDATKFIDPSKQLVARISKWRIASGSRDIFFTSGDVANMKAAALAAFKARLSDVRRIDLSGD